MQSPFTTTPSSSLSSGRIVPSELSDYQLAVLQRMLESTQTMTVGMMVAALEHAAKARRRR